jgi:hypothetical protein
MAGHSGFAMKVSVSRDESLDACTITHENVHLETLEDVQQWRRLVMGRVQAIAGVQRVYLLVDYHGFTLNPALADEYGKVAEELRSRFARDVFRYGATDPLSAASARLQSMKRSHSSNLFATREQAIRALRIVRGS